MFQPQLEYYDSFPGLTPSKLKNVLSELLFIRIAGFPELQEGR